MISARLTAIRYSLPLALCLAGIAHGHAGSAMNRYRTAQSQSQTAAECVERCNSNNYSCSRNCGLSGACVAQCTVEADACKKERHFQK